MPKLECTTSYDGKNLSFTIIDPPIELTTKESLKEFMDIVAFASQLLIEKVKKGDCDCDNCKRRRGINKFVPGDLAVARSAYIGNLTYTLKGQVYKILETDGLDVKINPEEGDEPVFVSSNLFDKF